MGCEKFALKSVLRPLVVSAMKLGEFRQVPEVIKRAKRHLDRAHSSGFTRRSFLAIRP